MKNHSRLFIIVIQSLLFTPLLTGETFTIGSGDGWEGCRLYNLKMSPGKGGFPDLVLARTALGMNEPFTDILLPLNDRQDADRSGHYRILSQPEYDKRHFKAGGGSAAFYRDTELVLKTGKTSALFAPFSNWEDFTVEFWLYPANPGEEENIIRWEGLGRMEDEIYSQSILCRFNNRRLVWSFSNFFQLPGQYETFFEISGSPVLPRQWNHHMLRYSSQTGMLEYLINGQPSAIIYTTPKGEESSTVLIPKIGEEPGELVLGSGFTGFMDEFRLERRFGEAENTKLYSQAGFGVSPVLDMEFPDSSVNLLEHSASVPDNTAVYLYYAMTNSLMAAEEYRAEFSGSQSVLEHPEIWHPVKDGSLSHPVEKGRYLVLSFLLFPDMKKDISPNLSTINVDYSPSFPPFPPSQLKAGMEGDRLHIQWSPSPSPGVDSYLVYFGEKPGEYIYPGSPLRIQGKTDAYIDGLLPFKQYFFAVKSCISGESSRSSCFSREISVRP